MKNPTTAALLNIIPGLGYLYLGSRRLFGALLLLGLLVSIITATIYDNYATTNFAEIYQETTSWENTPYGLTLLPIPIIIAAFMYDAYQEATRLNRKK